MKPNHIHLSSGRTIGHGHPLFLVAELGNNHQGDVAIALDMVRKAAQAGADAVKLQKRDTRSLLTREGREAPYTGENSFGATYGEHREALELSFAEMARVKELAEELGLVFFASAWDQASFAGLVSMGVELAKIASADLTTIPLLRAVAASGLPVILSTGMSTPPEIDAAVAELEGAPLALLHCNSSYPAPDEELNLPLMHWLARRYGLPVGYSGHEAGLGPSVAAAALGAVIIERHFTLDRSWRGTDHAASLDPGQFADLAAMVRQIEKAMAGGEKKVFPGEEAAAVKLRKSIVASRDLPAGTRLGPTHLTVKSPGTGISPLFWDRVLGMRLGRPLAADEMVAWEDLSRPQPSQSGRQAMGRSNFAL